MRARTAIAELLKAEPDWRDLFRSCCETSAFRLRAQTYRFRDELRERGHDLPRADVEDALMGLARQLVLEGRVEGEPSPELVAEMMLELELEEEEFDPDVQPGDA